MDHNIDCPICLNPFKHPVSLPCGHLYCKKCITQHINAPNVLTLTRDCPDCRTPFPIVLPDLANLPKKYHSFIRPAVRRVYIDTSNTKVVELQKKLEQAEQRLAEKTTECDDLRADSARLAAKNLEYYQKNMELSVEKHDLMNVIDDLEIELHNMKEGRQMQEETVVRELKTQINALGLKLRQKEEQLKIEQSRMAEDRRMHLAEMADLESKLQVAQDRIDADDREADGLSVTINELELDSKSSLEENERLKAINRELREIIKEMGPKKELAEENLKQITNLVRSQQASGSILRKRALATPPPMASGSFLPTKPLAKRRRIKIES